ncbi:MAG: hypothetical protein EBT21_06620, partial [Actinobacteria bacterium]|nr:hypothetical protein [Actinomycetota bacterium]
MRHLARRALALCVGAVLIASCSSGSSGTSPTDSSQQATESTVPEFLPSSFTWSECENAEPDSLVTCSVLEVPYDYEDPAIGSFS